MANLVKIKDGLLDTEGIYDTNEEKTQKALNADIFDKRIRIMDIPVTATVCGQRVETGLSVWDYGVLMASQYAVTTAGGVVFPLTVASNNQWKIVVANGNLVADSTTALNFSFILRIWYYKL